MASVTLGSERPAHVAEPDTFSNLQDYVTDRLTRANGRLFLYAIGTFLASFEIGVTAALATFVLMYGADLVDCWQIRRMQRVEWRPENIGWIKRNLLLSGFAYGVCFALGPIVLYLGWLDTDVTLMVVFAVLTMGSVQTALSLPYFPAIAISKLVIYAATATVVVLYRLWNVNEFIIDRTLVIFVVVTACALYSLVAFAKAGMKSYETTVKLRHSQRLERETNDKLQRLSLIAENTSDCIVMSGPDGRIEWVNDAFVTATGYPKSEAIGTHEAAYHAGSDSGAGKSQSLAFKGESLRQTHSGQPIWMSVNKFPIYGAGGDLENIVSIERDITRAKKRETDLANAKEAAEAASRVKAEFLANMSHEIRTPLTGVIGMTELLSETELSAEQTQYLGTIQQGSTSLLALINDILDLSKLESGKAEISPIRFEIRPLFESLAQIFSSQTQAKKLDMQFEVSPEVPKFLVADNGRIRQIVTNLLGNAVKFTDQGYVRLAAGFSKQGAQSSLTISVCDSGIGIAPDKIDKIFQKFTQAESSTSRLHGGTGLGLSISKHLARLMGGDITIKSELGKGACFYVTLPVEVAKAPIKVRPKRRVVARPDLSGLRGFKVLVAEDNLTNLFIIKSFLKDLPIEVETAKDGAEAVSKAVANPPDLIFMDMSMPRMGGVEATRQIRLKPMVQPKIVALTANVMAEQRQACLDAGMDGFMTKPIKRQELVQCVQTAQNR